VGRHNQARKALQQWKRMIHYPDMPASVARVEGIEEAAAVLQDGDASRCGRIAPPPISGLVEKKKLIPFGWYGGKFSHLDWLLPLLPNCHHYCEPFAGSGAVLLNREPSPVETFNDLDGEVVNFFRVLREEKERLVEAIGLTPFAREEFALACEISPDLSALERARRFYVRARQVRTGLGADGHSWPLGELQKHQSRWHERRYQPVAGRGGRFAGGGRTVAPRSDRKSSGSVTSSASTIHRARCFTATRLMSIPRAATRKPTGLK
jgi:hypothetical protein